MSANYGAGTMQAFGELGYTIETGMARFEPFASVAHMRLKADAFTEAGGAGALSGASQTSDVTFTTLGLRAEHQFTAGTMDGVLHGMVGWRHAMGDVSPQSTQRFSTGDPFTISGAPVARDSAVIEAGLDLNLGAEASLDLSYTGQVSGQAVEQGFKANLSVRF
jgi:outer membrane autotransporter protein